METQIVAPEEGNPADSTTASLTFLDRAIRAYSEIAFRTIEGLSVGVTAVIGAVAIRRIVETGATFYQDPQLYGIATAYLAAASASLLVAETVHGMMPKSKIKK